MKVNVVKHNPFYQAKDSVFIPSRIPEVSYKKESLSAFAAYYSGKLLDAREYHTTSDYERLHFDPKFQFQCYNGHNFKEEPSKINERGYFCPTCNESKETFSTEQFLYVYKLVTSVELTKSYGIENATLYNNNVLLTNAKYRNSIKTIEFVEKVGNAKEICKNCPLTKVPKLINPTMKDSLYEYYLTKIAEKWPNDYMNKEQIATYVQLLFRRVLYPTIIPAEMDGITIYKNNTDILFGYKIDMSADNLYISQSLITMGNMVKTITGTTTKTVGIINIPVVITDLVTLITGIMNILTKLPNGNISIKEDLVLWVEKAIKYIASIL